MHKSFFLLPIFLGVSLPAIAASSDVPITYAEKGMKFSVTKKGATINITTGKISDVAISDKSCVVYSQIQNSIYVKQLNPCLRFEGVGAPDKNPTLRVWVESKILEFHICTGCSNSRNINIVSGRSLEPFVKRPAQQKQSTVIPVPTQPKITVIEPIPPAPIVDPTQLIAQPSIYQVETPPNPFPLLKPIPEVFSDRPLPRVKRKRVRRVVKVEPLPKKEQPQFKIETPIIKEVSEIAVNQDLTLSPSQRALAEIKQPTVQKAVEEKSKENKLARLSKVKKIKWSKSVAKPITRKEFKLATNQLQAKVLLKGLNIARRKRGDGHIAYRSHEWMTIQDTYYYLKVGNSLDAAIRKSNASKPLVEKLIKLGVLGG